MIGYVLLFFKQGDLLIYAVKAVGQLCGVQQLQLVRYILLGAVHCEKGVAVMFAVVRFHDLALCDGNGKSGGYHGGIDIQHTPALAHQHGIRQIAMTAVICGSVQHVFDAGIKPFGAFVGKAQLLSDIIRLFKADACDLLT